MKFPPADRSPANMARVRYRRLRYRAYAAVRRAKRDGTLVVPDQCERCGAYHWAIQAHHHDYEKPLDVEWLCPSCHQQEHADD